MIYRKPSIAEDVSFVSIQKTLYNAGKKKSGKLNFSTHVFKDVYEFGKFLEENPDQVKYTDESGDSTISFKMIQSSSKSFHVILFDKSLLAKCKKSRIYVDGTFDTRPRIKGICQFVTIMAKLEYIVSMIFINKKKYNNTFHLVWCLVYICTCKLKKKFFFAFRIKDILKCNIKEVSCVKTNYTLKFSVFQFI